MPRPRWTVAVDLDGILCENTSPDKYHRATPIEENIKKVNYLYDKGWVVLIHTGRGWYLYDMTKEWLESHRVKHSELVMGKVVAHYYIDDRNSTLDLVIAEGR